MKIYSRKALNDAQISAKEALMNKDDFVWGAAIIALKIAYGHYEIDIEKDSSISLAEFYYNAD